MTPLQSKNFDIACTLFHEQGPEAAYLFTLQTIKEGDDSLGTLCIVSEYALQAELYKEAIDFYTQLLHRSIIEQTRWYWDGSLVCRAYCFMKTGYYDKAKEDLSTVYDPEDPDCTIVWLFPPGHFSKKSILEEIALYEKG